MNTSEVHEKDLGKGTDARNSENQIETGFFEDMVNAESDGNIVKKRRGYQQLGGYLPFKVQSVETVDGSLCFNLDSYVNVSRVRSSPITVRGTVYDTGLAGVDFETNTFIEQHYTGFDVSIRRSGTGVGMPASPPFTFTIPQPSHGHTSWLQHSSIYLSTSLSNLNNEFVYPDTHDIVSSDLTDAQSLTETTINLNNSDQYIHASIDASTLGLDHYYPNTAGVPDFTTAVVGANTLSFDVAATSLRSTNLVISVYEDIGSNTVRKIIPDDITITGTQVDITFTTGAVSDFIYVATAVPDSQVAAGQVTNVSQEVVIPNVTPFTEFAIYTLDGNIREYVIPDTAIYDDAAQELTVTFQPGIPTNFQIYYLESSLQANQVCVTPNVAVLSASNVELDLYGLDPLTSMTEENRNHWLTHIDTYRSQGNTELVTAVAGAQYRLDSTGLSTVFPRYTQTLQQAQYLTPYFQDTGKTFATSIGRGYLTSTGGAAGPELTTVTYQSGTGFVRYTLSVPDVDITNITVGAGPSQYTVNIDGTYTSTLENDQLTVTNAGYSKVNGTHDIESITVDPDNDLVYVDCSVNGIINSDYDEENVGGYVQIYTSPLTLDNSPVLDNTLAPGTRITVGGAEYLVRGNSFSSEEKLLLSEVTQSQEVSSGLFITGSAARYIVPIASSVDGETVEGYVRGDTIKYSTADRWQRIKDIIQRPSEVVTLSGSTLTFAGAGTALNFEAGQRLLLVTEGTEGGVVTINTVASDTELTLDTTFTATAARVIGKTFEIDEQLSVVDSVDNSASFVPTARWHAIQAVSAPDTFLPAERSTPYSFTAFETTSQELIRSTMASDNMYLTNGEDPIVKYDGTNVSRAGLFRWEGATFVRKADTTTGAIVPATVTVAGTGAINTKTFTATTVSEVSSFVSGQVLETDTAQKVTVVSVDVDNGVIVTDTPFSAAVSSLSNTSLLKYYFRLNIVDGNNNIIGSAASGVDNNYTIELGADSTTVGIKLAKPPKLDLFDYERLEYEVYRTKQDGEVFFKVATISVDYTDTVGYVYYEDTAPDRILFEADTLSTSTFGAELATAIDEPLRAKYITSANNRLVLGNLKDSHKVDVQIFRPNQELIPTEMNNLSFALNNSSSGGLLTYRFLSSSITDVASVDANGLISPNLGIPAGSWVYIFTKNDSAQSGDYLGWFKTTAPNTIDTDGTASLSNLSIITGNDTVVPIFAGAEFNDDDAGYQDVTESSTQILIQSKLVNAINATQFEAGTQYTGAGRADIGQAGAFTIKSVDNSAFTLTITQGVGTGVFDVAAVFVNNAQASSGVASSSVETPFASRMLVSFPNFPEIFDRPTEKVISQSQSIIDINSADGQEITGIIPFFGESTSQDSRKQDVVICFKENSIYAVNITTRQITKIDSRGVGCNAPNSIAAVPNGIIFAARSGVYRLNRSFDVIWVGRYLDRIWNERTNLSRLNLATGHVYPQEKQYRLSVPVNQDEQATEVYVYEYGDEAQGQSGAWGRFDNIPSTGWASDGSESYFASSKGRMYTIRNTSTDSDFRDDDGPINWQITYRGMDFGAPGRRKIVRAIVSHFRVLKTDSGTTMDVGVDLTTEFNPTTSFTLQDTVIDGLSETISSKVKSIRQNLQSQKGIYFQVRYTNNTIDTPVALAGITYHVAGLGYSGITQAADT